MKTHCVLTTDWHLDQQFPDNRVSTTILSFLDLLKDEIKPNMLIHAGDIFNSKKPGGTAVEVATIFFSEISKICDHIVILPGNHDIDAYRKDTAVDFLDDLGLECDLQIMYEPTLVGDYLFMPYMRSIPDETKRLITQARYIIAHQGYENATVNGSRIYGKRKDAIPADLISPEQVLLSGHIHIPWASESMNVVFPGAPYQRYYSDPLMDRGFLEFDLEDIRGTLSMTEYPNNFKLVKDEIKISEFLPKKQLLNKLPPLLDRTFYSIIVATEKKLAPTEERKVGDTVRGYYGVQLEDFAIVSIVPRDERTVYSTLKQAASNSLGVKPNEILMTYLKTTAPAYFEANHDLLSKIGSEFEDITEYIDETYLNRKDKYNRKTAN